MFRSSAIIREFALNLAKVIFMLKHSVKCFNININLARFIAGTPMMVEDRNM